MIQVRRKGNDPRWPRLGFIDQGPYLVGQTLMPLFRLMGGNLQCNGEKLLRLIA